MSSSEDVLKSLAKGFMPQEEMLEIEIKSDSLFIGIPKETSFFENRISLVPDAVALLVSNGHRIVIERGAGEGAHFSDQQYSEAGAIIADDVKEVYKADIILMVAPPNLKEIDLLKNGQTVISALQLPIQPKNFLQKLMDKKITAIAFDYITDEDGIFPIVRAMSEIAGTTSVLIAAELLNNTNKGKGMMFGGVTGISPTEVVVLGAGTVGEFACRAALGLGANVKVFNNSIYKLRRLQEMVGHRVYTSIIQPKALTKALKEADVVIGAIRAIDNGRTPVMVTEEMIKLMKEGSVIVDVSIDKGGCFETSQVTSHENPTYTKYGVVHYCVPNIASRVAKTSSYALSNVIAPAIIETGQWGGINGTIRRYKGIRNGIYIYKGMLTNKYLGETFNLPYKDIELILPAI
jgi:alanine dehydrogenase